ncbi:hypothetical protein HKT11_01835 [Serratia marcescens]|uniref:hypothetical protein n=1 Tax=Serratia marcescens TaxID=615 RepID=UPI00155FAA40|nr:hypothetical protein [Serratia marcescens]NRN18105.1 hypothetical protein [Serratia marcescens]NRN22327.1 hypothetical protein [Serratia marcescens]NRN55553.1 hypothetical protein [Serratia marcescens]
MEGLIVFVALASALAFFIGLIKPQWVRMPSRKGASVIYGIIFICASTLGSALYPTEKKNPLVENEPKIEDSKAPTAFEDAGLTLIEYRRKSQTDRHEIVSDYVKFKGIPANDSDGFYACLSQYSITKSEDLPLGEVLGWCDAGYQKNPKSMSEYTNLDTFQGNFSGWDGSYRPLEKLIKKSMNDDSSYKHVETMSHLVLGKDPHAVVKTRFKGTNAYGGVVTQTVTARVDIRSGDIVQIIEE